MLEDRVRGQTVQRIQQHTVNQIVAPTLPNTVDEIEKELRIIESSVGSKKLSSVEDSEKSEGSQTEE